LPPKISSRNKPAPGSPVALGEAGRNCPGGDDEQTQGEGQPKELTGFLAPPQGPGKMGRLGPYRVLQVLDAGGMGVVYKAEDPQLKRLVALKAMLPKLAAVESARKRFLREAQSAAAIEHDHIVPIYQVGQDRGVPFLAMQLLKGEPLDQPLQREPKLPVAEDLRIGRETAVGLAAAHRQGLIHGDIKPTHLWLEGAQGRIKILDFGLARAGAADGSGTQLTQPGAIVGTPAYMAPEQAGVGRTDQRSDLFSRGWIHSLLGCRNGSLAEHLAGSHRRHYHARLVA
jgi:serine/threonine protein kinase